MRHSMPVLVQIEEIFDPMKKKLFSKLVICETYKFPCEILTFPRQAIAKIIVALHST